MMDNPTRRPYTAPLTEHGIEEIKEQVLETEIEAGLSEERKVLEEMRLKTQEAEELMADIRNRIERIKEGE